ncbi:MAG TPA: TMEM175 family protein [Hyphomicrobiaceae bacterium]|nr:TMEM175 family protein [Hyphomicrobiaceae bacterium]
MASVNAAPKPVHEGESDARAVDRLVFFSDAVIAIIITLMVLEVRLPPLAEHASQEELLQALIALIPKYLAVLLSFLVIGLFWTLHHRRFNWVRKVDERLVWCNLVYLLVLASVPFATGLLSEHSGWVSSIVYACVLALASLVAAVLWWHVKHSPEIIANDWAHREMRLAIWMSIATAGVFLGSIPVALWNHTIAQVMWVLVFFAGRAVGWAFRLRNPMPAPVQLS